MSAATLIHLRRDSLRRALRLSAREIQLLALLLVRACSSSGRVWDPPERLAEVLDVSVAQLEDSLERLGQAAIIERYDAIPGTLSCIELGDVLVRPGDAPPNLPVEPRV